MKKQTNCITSFVESLLKEKKNKKLKKRHIIKKGVGKKVK